MKKIGKKIGESIGSVALTAVAAYVAGFAYEQGRAAGKKTRPLITPEQFMSGGAYSFAKVTEELKRRGLIPDPKTAEAAG